jgi:4,5-dihydroxyphthalate decarboxylase
MPNGGHSTGGARFQAWSRLSEEEKIFETDPWTYGLEANRHVLDKFFAYCDAQGVSAKKIAPDELFYSSTLKLVE